MSQLDHAIRIKGSREGIRISLAAGPAEAMLDSLAADLAAKKGFLNGSRVTLDTGAQNLSTEDLSRVQEILAGHNMELWAVLGEVESTKDSARELGLATRLAGSNVDLDGRMMVNDIAPAELATSMNAESADGNGMLLRETLRSGRSVFHHGHVVVIGDVNPGAEIIAGGDVVVWGKLRGLVHAGAMGDALAVICALELIPTQLRIADQIAIPPGGKRQRSVPEQASIQDGQIVAEPWRARG